ncbi:flagellar hook-associated protein FlgL [Porticoccus sp. W117]|uniref:flagellar hook-associated protein FlgL n=1 Tax=Porticoccus sp. W117 TaxID=3054777 RepID=UPI00259A0C56|nr:flagellar hook-associated protein FlgL [Porticoccus sp. W117]MDM3871015.1 flagellar hook-associated protein FlgL [Porticoccus sp. W117]
MRLSTSQIFQQGINAILDQQAKLSKTQLQISTGQRINTPSDDPSGAVQILDFADQIATVEQYKRNGNAAKTQLQLEENVLTNMGSQLQRVRVLLVQGNNDVLSDADRQSIATELKGIRQQLLALGNSRDANGDYLFAGYQVNTQPFTFNGGSVQYNGDQGQRLVQLGPASQVAINDSGAELLLRIPEGNGQFTVAPNVANTGTAVVGQLTSTSSFVRDTYTLTFTQATPTDPITYQVVDSSAGVVASGTYQQGDSISFNGAQIDFTGTPANGDVFTATPASNNDLFSIVDSAIAALESPGQNSAEQAQFHSTINRALESIDNSVENILRVRTSIGVRLNTVDSQQNLNDDSLLQLQKLQSEVKDLDVAQAISELNFQQVALQAAQQAYVRVQGLSLFQLL